MNSERQREILKILLVQRRVTVRALAQTVYASEPSIRRDLAELERQHLLRRVHGGAVLEENAQSETKIPFLVRELEQSGAKNTIARKASALIRDDMVIFLDASSSAFYLLPFLRAHKNLLIVTSGVKTLAELSNYPVQAISTGGRMIRSCFSLVGEETYAIIRAYNADLCFFSCRGIAADGRLTDFSVEENRVRQCMIAQSRQSYCLCASEKIGKTYCHNLCHASDIAGIITEGALPAELQPYAWNDSPTATS